MQFHFPEGAVLHAVKIVRKVFSEIFQGIEVCKGIQMNSKQKMKYPWIIFLLVTIMMTIGSISLAFDPESVDIDTLKQMKAMPDEILVKFHSGVSEFDKQRVHNLLGAIKSRSGYGNFYHVVSVREGMVEEMISAYSEQPVVAYAEPNHFRFINFIPNDTYYSFQWHLDQINMSDAWNKSTGSGVTVAVVDTGISQAGEDGFGNRVFGGYNFVKENENFSDDNGHGTHVAGTIAQETDNGIGVAGIAYNANLLGVKVLNKKGSGADSGVADGIRWAADNGAQVINMSLGGDSSSQTLEDAVNYANERGVVICAAAGNSGADTIGYPARYDACIAVGSVRYDKEKADYSQYGAGLDVVAPGGDTSVDQNQDGYGDGVVQETFTKKLFRMKWGYYYFQGTSMATPHVSGLAALIIGKYPAYTPDQVRNAIESTAEDLGLPGYDTTYGYGLINASAALN